MYVYICMCIYIYMRALEGKEMLCSALSNFNKVASEKFEELDDDEKSRLAEIPENDTDTVLTDQQTDNIISDIFFQLRDNTVTTCLRNHVHMERLS